MQVLVPATNALELTLRKPEITHAGALHSDRAALPFLRAEQLLDEVWGCANFFITRTVDNHIAKLRQKLEVSPAEPRHIITVHRVGYRFIPESRRSCTAALFCAH